MSRHVRLFYLLCRASFLGCIEGRPARSVRARQALKALVTCGRMTAPRANAEREEVSASRESHPTQDRSRWRRAACPGFQRDPGGGHRPMSLFFPAPTPSKTRHRCSRTRRYVEKNPVQTTASVLSIPRPEYMVLISTYTPFPAVTPLSHWFSKIWLNSQHPPRLQLLPPEITCCPP